MGPDNLVVDTPGKQLVEPTELFTGVKMYRALQIQL